MDSVSERLPEGKKESRTHSKWQLGKVPNQNCYHSFKHGFGDKNELAKAKSNSRVPCWPNDGYFVFCTFELDRLSWVFKETIPEGLGVEISVTLCVTFLARCRTA